ncbi:hypothetical protein [Micromonospora chersina]|uniref:hypothetical protein n=1 Tax=Micromonospora chersina TaxID=47854 RepID=UPI0033F69B42
MVSSSSLLSALVIGVTVGLVGRLVLPGPKAAPVWLTVALGVAASQLGSITARLVGVKPDALMPGSVAQVGFAVPVVVLAVIAAGRLQPQDGAVARVDRVEQRGGGRPRSGGTLRGPA